MFEPLIVLYAVLVAIACAHRDKLSIDSNLKDAWHRWGFILRFLTIGGPILTMLLPYQLNFGQAAYLVVLGGVTFWSMFDPYLNYLRGKGLNHLGSNALDVMLGKIKETTKLEPIVVKMILLGLLIGFRRLILTWL